MHNKLFLTELPDGRVIEQLGNKIFRTTIATKQYNGKEFFVMENNHVQGELGGTQNTFSAITNHIGCKIFSLLQFPVAETMLCIKSDFSDEYNVVCLRENLDKNGQQFFTFQDIVIPHMDMFVTYLTADIDILGSVIEEISSCYRIDADAIKHFLTKMFIVDAYLGTSDRTIEKWGLVRSSGNFSLAPVFDCTASLFPEFDYVKMATIITDYESGNSAFADFISNGCNSSFYRKGHRLTYQSLLGTKECLMTEALNTVVPNIDDSAVDKIIDEEPSINPLHKQFLKLVLRERKKKILLPLVANSVR